MDVANYRVILKAAFLCLVGVASFASAARAVSDDIVASMAGQWLLASEDGSLGCRITLNKDKTIGGYALTEDKPCGPPWHEEVFAWDFSDGGIVLRDATRKTIGTFEEQEGGPYRTPEGVSPRIYLIPDPGTMERVPITRDMIGSWVLSDRKDKPLCHLKLLDRPAPGLEDAKAIELSPDCSAAVRKTKIEAWQISEIQVVFIGGEDWVYTLTPEAGGKFVSDDEKYHLARDTQ